MRLTAICYKQLPHKLFRKLVQNRRSLKPRDYGIPAALLAKGIPVYDGYKFSKERPPVDFSKYIPIQKPELQPEYAYEVSDSVRLTEGDAQVQLLTNSLYHKGMPAAYLDKFDNTPLSDSEYAWMSNRFEVVKHDSHQTLLPKVYHHEWHWIALEREYGPSKQRRSKQMSLIFNDFVRLTSTSGSPKPSLNDLTCQFLKPTGHPYIFRGSACSGTLSKEPLPLVGDPLVTGALPSMYPAAPEMDLRKTFDYDPKTVFPIVSQGQDYNLHTIYVNHPFEGTWSRQERYGIALLQTFAFAAARAATSQKPLVLQTVYHDLDHVDFVVMQLNTLQSSSEIETDVRNEIWHVSSPLREGEGTEQTLSPVVMKWLKVFYAR